MSEAGAQAKEYDCAECGLCCANLTGKTYLYQADLDRWRDEGVTGLVEIFETTCAGKPCPFLTTGKPWRCTIYSERPLVCSDFPNGGTHCQWIRAQHGLPL